MKLNFIKAERPDQHNMLEIIAETEEERNSIVNLIRQSYSLSETITERPDFYYVLPGIDGVYFFYKNEQISFPITPQWNSN